MSNYFFDPANRALSSVICKMIKNKGFPQNIFETLYNSCVTSITDYAHEVIGFHQYTGSAQIHSRAIRAYLGVGQSAPLCGIRLEMQWPEPRSRTQIRMLNFYHFLQNMPDSRLTKNVDIKLWFLKGCVAACLLSLSISVGLCSYCHCFLSDCVAARHLHS